MYQFNPPTGRTAPICDAMRVGVATDPSPVVTKREAEIPADSKGQLSVGPKGPTASGKLSSQSKRSSLPISEAKSLLGEDLILANQIATVQQLEDEIEWRSIKSKTDPSLKELQRHLRFEKSDLDRMEKNRSLKAIKTTLLAPPRPTSVSSSSSSSSFHPLDVRYSLQGQVGKNTPLFPNSPPGVASTPPPSVVVTVNNAPIAPAKEARVSLTAEAMLENDSKFQRLFAVSRHKSIASAPAYREGASLAFIAR